MPRCRPEAAFLQRGTRQGEYRSEATVPGVAHTEIDLKTATVTVTFDADHTSVPMLARTITDAGFPAVAAARGG
jgi:mercuric ion binding protein